MNNPSRFNESHYKLKLPCRDQMEMQLSCLDAYLPLDHRARRVWEFVNKMDTGPCYDEINSFCLASGRPTTSPKVLFALWLYTILDGNSSARKLDELCKHHDAYKWLAGGVPINRTMLAEFRSSNVMKFEDLLTNCLAVMVKAGLIADEDFAQDGTKIKANAGFGSYHREESLQKIKEEIKAYIKRLDAESVSCTNAYEKQKNAKNEQIAKERLNQVEEALHILEKERNLKKENGDKYRQSPTEEELKEVRASTTDPNARKMKMGDGGFRLAYNVQFATGLKSRVIYGACVVTTLDPGTTTRLMAKVNNKLKKLNLSEAQRWVADAAYSGKDDIEAAARLFPNCQYFTPAKPRKGIDPKKHRKTDSVAVKKWRDTLGSDEMAEIYKDRCSTAEFSNAQVKNNDLEEFSVRGIIKVTGMVLLHAIAQNVSRYFDLCKEVIY